MVGAIRAGSPARAGGDGFIESVTEVLLRHGELMDLLF
jgi:hypothetical protein